MPIEVSTVCVVSGSWDELREVLRRLAARDPLPLRQWPGPESEQQPPFDVGLAAWSTGEAEDLKRQFGEEIRLTVGALRYPERVLARPRSAAADAEPPDLDQHRIAVALDGPLTIRSGHQAEHGLLITNKTDQPASIETAGYLFPAVVDPGSGQVVGGFSGFVSGLRKVFGVPAGDTVTVPLLVGTDSFRPELGYAVPPGQWGLRATLSPELGRTPVLPLTIT